MRARTFWGLLRSGRLRLLMVAARHTRSFYRIGWLAGAARGGVLARLAAGPVPAERLAADLAPDPAARDALRAWLRLGAQLGEIAEGPDGWRLRGYLARRLAEPAEDAVAAICEEAATVHHALLTETPRRVRSGRLFTLADQEGTVIARSSRLLEPLVRDAIDAFYPAAGPMRLLEVGCGSGTYIRYAAERNPALDAVGLELQPEVAALAARNLAAWGIAGRVRVETGDVRDRPPEPAFDVVTLHNNVYYFPVRDRVALFAHLRGFLRPGGRVVVTTGCAGGTVAMQALDLWSAATAGCGRLPAAAELAEQMRAAGLTSVRSRRLLPGDSFYGFVGFAPA